MVGGGVGVRLGVKCPSLLICNDIVSLSIERVWQKEVTAASGQPKSCYSLPILYLPRLSTLPPFPFLLSAVETCQKISEETYLFCSQYPNVPILNIVIAFDIMFLLHANITDDCLVISTFIF